MATVGAKRMLHGWSSFAPVHVFESGTVIGVLTWSLSIPDFKSIADNKWPSAAYLVNGILQIKDMRRMD